jgi:hypothetical protein
MYSMCMSSMCMSSYASRNFNKINFLYIDGHPRTHGNIAEFIKRCRSSLFSENCSFEEHSTYKKFFMKRNASRFIVVQEIHSMSPGHKLLINYNSCKPPIARKKCLALGLPLNMPLGHKKKIIE